MSIANATHLHHASCTLTSIIIDFPTMFSKSSPSPPHSPISTSEDLTARMLRAGLAELEAEITPSSTPSVVPPLGPTSQRTMASLFKPPEFLMPAEGFQGGSIAQAHSSPKVTLGNTTPCAVNPCDVPLGVKQVGKWSLSGNTKLSVFDILNIFCWRWFLLTNQLETHIFLAQKAEDRKIFWVEFSPQFHTHLVKCTVALVPHPIQKVKKVMFIYLLELLNRQGHQAFFNLAKGTRIVTQVQKEKKQLAWRRNRTLR